MVKNYYFFPSEEPGKSMVTFLDLKEHVFLDVFPTFDLGIEINWEYRYDEGPFTAVIAKLDETTMDEFLKAMSSLSKRIMKTNPEYKIQCEEFRSSLDRTNKENVIYNICNSL